MSRIHTFEKRQCDRCQHRSAVKNTPPPPLSLPVPIPPPHRTHHPSANCPGPMISGLLDPVTSSANGVASLAQSIGSVLFRSAPLPPSCPVPAGLLDSRGHGRITQNLHSTYVTRSPPPVQHVKHDEDYGERPRRMEMDECIVRM